MSYLSSKSVVPKAILKQLNSPATTRTLSLVAILTAALALTIAFARNFFFSIADATNYVHLADHSQPVMLPFASRQLAPIVVQAIALTLGISIQHAFLLQGIVCFLLFVTISFSLIRSFRPSNGLILAILPLPFWSMLVMGLVLPDVFFASLLALLLWLLHKEHYLAAAFMFLPLVVARESTIIVLICFLIVAFRRIPWYSSLTAIASFLAGSFIVKRLTANALPNTEHLEPMLYLLAKAPWNFLHNVLGVSPWSNVSAFYCTVPIWQVRFTLGPVKAIGICGLDPIPPLITVWSILGVFGILTLLVSTLVLRIPRKGRSFLQSFALLYGIITLLIAPLLGTGTPRLVGYSWPIILITLPALIQPIEDDPNTTTIRWDRFLILHFLVCALATCEIDYFLDFDMFRFTALIVVANIAGFFVIRNLFRPTSVAA